MIVPVDGPEKFLSVGAAYREKIKENNFEFLVDSEGSPLRSLACYKQCWDHRYWHQKDKKDDKHFYITKKETIVFL